MASSFDDKPNKVYIDPKDITKVYIEEQVTHVEISQGGPQGPQGIQGLTGVQGSLGVQGGIGGQGLTGVQGVQGALGTQGIQGVQGVQGTTGIQGFYGIQGIIGKDGNFGGATFDYTYSSITTASDPGVGRLRFNNSNLTLATALYIDSSDDSPTNISSFLTTIDDSTSSIKGHFRVSKKFDSSVFALYTITLLSDNTGWFTVNGSYVSGSTSSLTDLDDIIITFARTGDRGDTGIQGIQGTQGVQGTQGTQGIQGTQGVQGIQGTQGTQGVQGVQGVQGTQGVQGIQGTQGVQGLTGTQGLTGIQGLQGVQGIQGIQGVQGIVGAISVTYDVVPPNNPPLGAMWVDSNTGIEYTYIYDGNSYAWVELRASGYVGAQGTIGIQGYAGTTGTQGTTGAGVQGANGTNGIQGATGTLGLQGTTGSGVQGTIGTQGLTGVQGIAGTFGGEALDYKFSTDTTSSAPAAGYYKFNNTDLTLATVMYIAFLDDNGTSAYSFLQTIDDSTSNLKGHFTIASQADPTAFVPPMFAITGYHTEDLVNQFFAVPVSYVSGSNPTLALNSHQILTFARTGDKGDTGLQGIQGTQGIVGTRGMVVQASTPPTDTTVMWMDTAASAAMLTAADIPNIAESQVTNLVADLAAIRNSVNASYGFAPNTVETVPRWLGQVTLTATTGTQYFQTFSPVIPLTISQLEMSGNSTAGVGITAASMALYSIDASDNATIIGQTINDTTLFTTVQTHYTRTLYPSVVVTAASAAGGTVTYTANNSFSAGQTVTIVGLSTAAFNLTSVIIATASATQFTVTNAATGTAVTGATASAFTTNSALSYTLQPGSRYAVSVLVAAATTMPNIIGSATQQGVGGFSSLVPRQSASKVSISNGNYGSVTSWVTTTIGPWGRVS